MVPSGLHNRMRTFAHMYKRLYIHTYTKASTYYPTSTAEVNDPSFRRLMRLSSSRLSMMSISGVSIVTYSKSETCGLITGFITYVRRPAYEPASKQRTKMLNSNLSCY